jgi:filamentous hemagglutinin family protein
MLELKTQNQLRFVAQRSTERRRAREALALAMTLVCALCTVAQAQIRTDGSLNRPALALSGPNFLITEAQGRLAGSNLFYSFQVFNVGNTESATFVTTTAGLANVISRVTGGSPSQINGPVSLQSTSAAPNFFFINPAGVVFGRGAQIDVPAGFHVSTADYLKFPDGNFYVDPKAVSTLSSAAPEAFGFLGTTRAAITLGGGAILQTTSPKPDQPISLVAGDIEINGATVQTSGSDIRLVAVGSNALEVGLTGALPSSLGNLSLVNSGLVSSGMPGTVSPLHSGDIFVSAGNVRILNGGFIDASTRTTGNAGGVTLSAGTLTIDSSTSGNVTGIRSDGLSGTGNAGDIHVAVTGNLLLNGAAPIVSNVTSGTGNTGSVTVTVGGELSIANGGDIGASTFGPGNAGTVTVKAGTLSIDGKNSGSFTGLGSSTGVGSTGNAGDVKIAVDGTLSIVNNGEIQSGTFGSGNAGTVTVRAGTLVINGAGGTLTGIFDGTNRVTGNGGSIDVTVDGALSIVNGGEIAANTFSSGKAGSVTVTAGTLTIDGDGTLTGIASQAGIPGMQNGTGDAGAINVTVNGTLSIVNGGVILVGTSTPGNAGRVTVKAGTLVIDGGGVNSFTGITSNALLGSTGNAGDVNVVVDGTLSINQGAIDSSTFSAGRAGSVFVKAREIFAGTTSRGGITANASDRSSGQTGTIDIEASEGITLSNEASFQILNSATVSNPGGLTPTLLTVTAPNISLSNGAQFNAESFGNVAASNIRVNFGPQLTVNNATITTTANTGNGGSIALRGTGALVLENGQITTSVTGRQGNGGDITISVPALVMNTGFIQANTAATNASGGNVTIDVDELLTSGSTLFVGRATPFIFTPDVFGFNVIQAAAPTGVSGAVLISSPVQDLIGSISALPAGFLDSGGLGRSPCAIVGGSSLSQVGRGGMPRRAGDFLWIEAVIETPATGSGSVVPPYRNAGSNVRSKANPCWS